MRIIKTILVWMALSSLTFANCWDYAKEKKALYDAKNIPNKLIEFVWSSEERVAGGYGGNHVYIAHKEGYDWIGECNEEPSSILEGDNWQERTKNRYPERNIEYVRVF